MPTGWWDWTPRWSEKSLDDTIALWEPKYQQRDPSVKLTHEDAREILTNLHGFFGLLAKWDAQEKEKRANGTGSGAPAEPPTSSTAPSPLPPKRPERKASRRKPRRSHPPSG